MASILSKNIVLMKIIPIISFLIPSLLLSQKTVSEDYKKIPEILDNTDLLYPFIKPETKYEYWSILRKDTKDPIYESQSPLDMGIYDLPFTGQGFFDECEPNGCFTYLIACESNKPKYFTGKQQLRDFISTVDNLPEAILIAKTYGFTVDSSDKMGSSYKIDDKNVSLYLSKSKNCPATKESFLIKINRKTGKLESKSNGVYFKGENCN